MDKLTEVSAPSFQHLGPLLEVYTPADLSGVTLMNGGGPSYAELVINADIFPFFP